MIIFKPYTYTFESGRAKEIFHSLEIKSSINNNSIIHVTANYKESNPYIMEDEEEESGGVLSKSDIEYLDNAFDGEHNFTMFDSCPILGIYNYDINFSIHEKDLQMIDDNHCIIPASKVRAFNIFCLKDPHFYVPVEGMNNINDLIQSTDVTHSIISTEQGLEIYDKLNQDFSESLCIGPKYEENLFSWLLDKYEGFILENIK